MDLLYAMCDKGNAEEIVAEMLSYLETADYSIREEMVILTQCYYGFQSTVLSRLGPEEKRVLTFSFFFSFHSHFQTSSTPNLAIKM